jgi:glycerol-3-phosphate acyltransferase PlsY
VSLVPWLLGAYLVGSIPTSFLAARYGAGIDLREHGSKNLGATNLYRTLGWGYAVPVGLFDVAKGAVPAFLAAAFLPQPWAPLAVGVAAVLGHVFSVFLRFRGGKGVATAAGVVLALAPAALGIAALVWLAVLLGTGYVSLASMLGAIAFPVAARLVYPANGYALAVGVALALFIVYTHHSNIKRLLAGNENRFGRRGRQAKEDA